MNVLADYADILSGKAYSPREYFEHQLNMTDEEKEQRRTFFSELFAQHNAKKQDAKE